MSEKLCTQRSEWSGACFPRGKAAAHPFHRSPLLLHHRPCTGAQLGGAPGCLLCLAAAAAPALPVRPRRQRQQPGAAPARHRGGQCDQPRRVAGAGRGAPAPAAVGAGGGYEPAAAQQGRLMGTIGPACTWGMHLLWDEWVHPGCKCCLSSPLVPLLEGSLGPAAGRRQSWGGGIGQGQLHRLQPSALRARSCSSDFVPASTSNVPMYGAPPRAGRRSHGRAAASEEAIIPGWRVTRDARTLFLLD